MKVTHRSHWTTAPPLPSGGVDGAHPDEGRVITPTANCC